VSPRRAIYFIAGFLLVGPGLADAAESYAVFKSTDRGRSWSRADAGLPGPARINAFGIAGDLIVAGTDAGIFTSADSARTWQPSANGGPGRVLSLATVGARFFAGADGSGLWVSGDQGQSWQRSTAFSGRKVRSLVAAGGKLFAGTDADGVFASVDGGETWRELPGLPANAQVFALAVVAGRTFAGLYSKGLFWWNETERQWIRVADVLPLALAAVGETLIAGHNPGGLYSSRDLGRSWFKGAARGMAVRPKEDSGELSPEAPIWELGANGEMAIAGAAGGIFYSEDRGRSWTRARTGLPLQSPGISFLVQPSLMLAAAQVDLPTAR
jgi:photosystem II stability/assembly factor-like uncharacterized protein